jgi:dihydropyrimidine dehydrogenase (NAD+) subunit PreA
MTRTIRLLTEKIDIPVIFKLSPLFEPPAYYAKVWLEAGADAITAHNAPTGMMIDIEAEAPFCAPYVCGYLPGRAYLPISIGRIVEIKRAFPEVVILGLGGVYHPDDAIMYLLAGTLTAGAVSSAYQHGREIFPHLVKGLEKWMEHKGYTRIEEFAGKALEKVGQPAPESHPIPFPVPELPSDVIAKVNLGSCTFCKLCEVCLYESIKVSPMDQTLEIDPETCWGCGYCVGICPEDDTLTLVSQKTGEVVWNNRGLADPLLPLAPKVGTAKTPDDLVS